MLEEPGTPPRLAVVDLPVPRPGPGEALVRVAACGFCHHDLLVMNGVLRRGVRPGTVLGHEISGVVEEVGEGVTLASPGDRVVSLLTNVCGHCDRCLSGREHRCRNGEGIGHGRHGGFAEFVVLSQHSLVALPETTDLTRDLTRDMARASLLACPAGVALQGLTAVGVSEGETVVVIGAGGGLGVHSVQLAKAMGARVVAVTSTSGKATVLYRHGADEVIESPPAGSGLDFWEVIVALTEDEGADVVVDTVGTPTIRSSIRSLGQYGRLVLLGEVGGDGDLRGLIPEIVFRDARVVGSSGVSRASLERAVELAVEGAVSPAIQQVLTLEEAEQAAKMLADRAVLGRLALAPGT